MAISTYLADVWSATEFGDPELSGYAEEQLRKDTRIGVQTMAGLSFAMQLCIALLSLFQGLSSIYLYTSALFGLLSLHILISAQFVKDVRALQTLGMAFLIVGAVAVTVLAHRSGVLNIGLMAAVIMLLIAVPLVPWALREATVVVGLTYALLTLSLISVPGRFETGSLAVLQTLVLGAAVVVLVIAGRNTFIRKQDIRTRFELEKAHNAMELLSMQDHLTGAWNRRYFETEFPLMAQQCRAQRKTLHVAILDIDDFKGINDQYGHQLADQVLRGLGELFIRRLGDVGRLIRMGGDEFLILYCGDDLKELIESVVAELHDESSIRNIAADRDISISAGFSSAGPTEIVEIETLYSQADRALYSMKKQREPSRRVFSIEDTLGRTGSWKL